jgi:hypothetical protein
MQLSTALCKLSWAYHTLADLNHAQAVSESVVVGDLLGYQGMNARVARDTFQQRTAVLEEYQVAVKSTIAKKMNMERLKASMSIRLDGVDEVLEDMEEVSPFSFSLPLVHDISPVYDLPDAKRRRLRHWQKSRGNEKYSGKQLGITDIALE